MSAPAAEVLEPSPPRPRRRARRRLLAAVVALVVLAAAVLLGAGWYYSGLIDDQALTVHRPADEPADDVVVVVSPSDGTVTLRRTGDGAASLASADTDGLRWDGGAGVLSGPPQVLADGSVRRSLEVRGALPPAAGTPAALAGDVWRDPGEAFGVAYSDVQYPCAGGACPAWSVPGRSDTWVVAVHGKGATRREPLRALGPAVAAGLPVLDVGYRNDPGAPADPSGRYGYGSTEWEDLDSAVGWAVDHGARSVVLFGSSMGGAIVASFLQHSPRAGLVRGVVFDAPALDLGQAVELGASQQHLPVVGGVPDSLTATAEWLAARRFGVDWAALDRLPADWLHVPALVFHGTADDTVPLRTSDELRASAPDLVQEVVVPGAGHVRSWNVDPAGYERREAAFLACVTAAAPAARC